MTDVNYNHDRVKSQWHWSKQIVPVNKELKNTEYIWNVQKIQRIAHCSVNYCILKYKILYIKIQPLGLSRTEKSQRRGYKKCGAPGPERRAVSDHWRNYGRRAAVKTSGGTEYHRIRPTISTHYWWVLMVGHQHPPLIATKNNNAVLTSLTYE